ncbi:MAG: hypothetical protein V1820_03730 [archaeon]
MDDAEVFAYVEKHLSKVQRPEFYPLLPKDSGPEGSPAFFRRVCELTFPAVADYLGAGTLEPPEIFCPDDSGFDSLAGIISKDAGIQKRSAKRRLERTADPATITFASREPAIWSGYFRPQSQRFYRDAAPEECAHYSHLMLAHSAIGNENEIFIEGLASGVVSEIGSLLPEYLDVSRRETARQIQAIYDLKMAETLPETIEFDNRVFGRAWYALATLGMGSPEKREFLGRVARL